MTTIIAIILSIVTHTSTTTAIVTDINYAHNTISFVDTQDDEWIWQGIEETYGMEIGKEYTIEFDNMGTLYKYDDEILDFYEN